MALGFGQTLGDRLLELHQPAGDVHQSGVLHRELVVVEVVLQDLGMASADLLLKLRQLLFDLLLGAAHRTTPTRDATTRRPDAFPSAVTADRQIDRPYPQLSGTRRVIACSGRNLADHVRALLPYQGLHRRWQIQSTVSRRAVQSCPR
ncbi:hypothetical protein ABR738_01600 [Streptomyces sp. Edi4]|uniref:hypothetical protein n=1 Tax=Streptomyces sp. Edi4 TaxID=3162527 RepID=UPI003306745D